jgi:transcriptional regulator with XRE-family HTH domain
VIGLKWWRRARGLTQEELSQRSGVSRETISRIETGKHLEPEVITLVKLAEALDVHVFELFWIPHQFPTSSPLREPLHVGVTPAPHERHAPTRGEASLE